MSFDLYFVGVPNDGFGVDKFLYSQYYNRQLISKLHDHLELPGKKLFLDSGAFTAFTRNAVLDIDDYIRYINANNNIITTVAALDVIPKGRHDIDESAERSWENFLYMRKRIDNPEKLIPTYHQTEPLKYLYQILNYEDELGKINYFALGGLVSTIDTNVRDRFLSECFKIILKLRPDINVHAFGLTDLKLLEAYPFRSADSTAYVLAAGMGEILTEFGRFAVSNVRCNDSKSTLKHNETFQLLQNYVAKFGYDLKNLMLSREERVRYNISYLQYWEKNRVCRYDSVTSRKLF